MKNLTSENFELEVFNSEKPVLVDFWANWCGPCRMLAPVLEEVAKEVTDVEIAKVNIDEQNALAAQYNVMSIPTLILFNKGQIKNVAVGYRSKSEVIEFINSNK